MLLLVGTSNFGLAAENAGLFTDLIRPALQQHCADCHGDGDQSEAELDLLEIKQSSDLTGNLEQLHQLIRVLDLQEMPPADASELTSAAREELVAALKTILRDAVSELPVATRSPIRRMNRFQYNNAVTDLFELNCVVFTLPERMLREHGGYFQPASRKMPDTVKVGSRPLGKSQLIERRLAGVTPFPQDLRAEHGFDNRGDHLSLSPLLLESFLRLSQSIVHSPDFGPRTCGIWKTFFAEPPAASEPANQDERASEVEGANQDERASEVRRRLRWFLTRAFRRPVDDALLGRYTQHVLAQLDAGVPFADGMKQVASAVLASPRFLYLYDVAQADPSGPVEPRDAEFDLASRLSFFLWGSLPDDQLLELAAQGQLRDPEVLAAQVDRMLDDRRLKRFCDSFPSQWLQLERIISSVPDRQQFPDFYFSKYRTSMHMMLEPLLLFETVLIEDRPVLELVDSDFSYRSDRLHQLYYGGKRPGPGNPVTVLPFHRVQLNDRRQGGVITNAAVMTMTSGPERTKPITRGAWLAAVIFNNPPKPPPADVPPLPEDDAAELSDRTLREQLAAHRERASCAGCHEQIDPLGFALENYGPTGKWRDLYPNQRQIDGSGRLFQRHAFDNVEAFKDAILLEQDRFVHAFASHLLSFALARELTAADVPAIDQITLQAKADNYRLRSLIKQVILSQSFRQ